MTKKAKRPSSSLDVHYDYILGDISNVIDAAKRSAARSVNCVMTVAYWLVGRRIVEFTRYGVADRPSPRHPGDCTEVEQSAQ